MASHSAWRLASVLVLFTFVAAPAPSFAAKLTYSAYDNDMAFPGWRLLFVEEVLDHGLSAIDLWREAPERLLESGLDQEMLYWVNKNFILPYPFAAADLQMIPPELTARPGQAYYFRAAAFDALLDLLAAGTAESGEKLMVLSSYRSYETQVYTYDYWVSLLGPVQADRESARAGHSEHQLGTVVDLTTLTLGTNPWTAFGDSAAGIWVKEQGHRFGFVISYHADKELITGYMSEPWHIRYVGVALATWLHEKDLSLEEAFQAVYGQVAHQSKTVSWALPEETNELCENFAYYDQQLWTCNSQGNALQKCAQDGSVQVRLCASGCVSCSFGTQDQCLEDLALTTNLSCETGSPGKDFCADKETMYRCVGSRAVSWQCEQRRCVSSKVPEEGDFFE